MTFETWLQTRLIAHGCPPAIGGADGIWGRASIAALEAFQAARNLPVTGVADGATVAALRAVPPDRGAGSPTAPAAPPMPPRLPPWHGEAGRLMGVWEVAGAGNSSAIMAWARRLGLAYPDDATPWCGLFAAHCIGFTLPDEPLPTNPLGARNWLRFGRKLAKPALGAILVFSRPGSSWSGHVGFYAGESKATFKVRGGNQSDAVTETHIAKSRLLGIRWPLTYPLPGSGEVIVGDGALSADEA